METNYVELIKQRFLSGNLSKPEELYDMLLVKMQKDKQETVIPWLAQFKGEHVLDIGGADGYLIKDMNFNTKTVLDKRSFTKLDGIDYIYEKYQDQDYNQDLVIMSEFLHLFTYREIEKFVDNIKCNTIIIENKYDDFLDLRLRMWSGGRCLDPQIMSDILMCKPIDLGEYLAWVK